MRLLDFIRRESRTSLGGVLSLIALSGLSNALILTIINAVLEASRLTIGFRYLLLFGSATALYVISKRRLLFLAATEVENGLDRVRVRLAEKIRSAELAPLEKIGRAEIFGVLNRDTLTISQMGRPLVQACQSVMLFLFTMLYIAWLSLASFIIFTVLMSIGVSTYMRRKKELSRELHEALERQNELFGSLTHVLEGFKEVKLHTARGDDLLRSIREQSAATRELKVTVEKQFAVLSIFSQTALYVGIGVLLFLLPQFTADFTDVAIKTTTAILFIMGPIYNVIGSLPDLANAGVAADNIYALEELLDRAIQETPEGGPPIPSFHEISLDGAVFHFTEPEDVRPFTVGPIHLTLRAGETVFITGGNGSGKSTLLKVISSLYIPQQGVVRVDGVPVGPAGYEAYRNLFSSVYWDYHLFDRLYGMPGVDPERVRQLLRELEIEGKTDFVDGRFTHLDLSTGQKKRLALVASLLEDRPILLLDEWAADQDPEFRRKFYDEILPRLQRSGKTIIAVTHDEKYFGRADRRLSMEDGRLIDKEDGAAR